MPRLTPVLIALLAACTPEEHEPAAPTCAEQLPGESWAPLPAAHPMQIHGTTAPLDGGFALAWNQPADDGSGRFVVGSAAYDCAGEVLIDPVVIDDPAANNVDPAVARAGAGLLLAWAADTAGTPFNLRVDLARVGSDGDAELLASPALDQGSAPWEGNAWMARLVPDGDDHWLVGARGVQFDPDTGLFQAFAQRLVDGAPAGATIDLHLDATAGQLEPSAAADAGRLVVAWQRDDGAISVLTLGPDDQPGDVLTTDGGTPFVAAGHDQRYVTWSGAEGVLVAPADDLDGAVDVGASGDALQPALAILDGETAAVVWKEPLGGLDHDLRARLLQLPSLEPLGEAWTISGDHPAVPYPADLVALGEGTAVLSWSSGSSPDFRLYQAAIRAS